MPPSDTARALERRSAPSRSARFTARLRVRACSRSRARCWRASHSGAGRAGWGGGTAAATIPTGMPTGAVRRAQRPNHAASGPRRPQEGTAGSRRRRERLSGRERGVGGDLGPHDHGGDDAGQEAAEGQDPAAGAVAEGGGAHDPGEQGDGATSSRATAAIR